MKNRFITLSLSSVFATLIVYGFIKLESYIHRLNNPDYAEILNDLAEFAIPDLGILIMFFLVVYPYQLVVGTLQCQLEKRGFAVIRIFLTIITASTVLYSIGFTIVFRSPYLGTTDTIQTFAWGTLIFSVYFLLNLISQHLLSGIGTERSTESSQTTTFHE